MKMRFINLIFLACFFLSCHKVLDNVEIKLLLLNPENYFNQKVTIHGKIKEIGPLNLWFIIEDEGAYIQVTTQNISEALKCFQKGQLVYAYGELEQYGVHKYFSLAKNFECSL